MNRPRDQMGDPSMIGGAAYEVGSVATIPMPSTQGPRNPLANDTPSQIPDEVAPKPRVTVKAPERDAVPLKSRKTKKERGRETATVVRLPKREMPDNQLTTSGGAQASSAIFTPTPGSGGVGIGAGAPFGQRFGAYAAVLRDRVARQWRTDEVDPRLKTAPEVIVTFDILRDGTVRNVRVDQRSGILALDNSAQRAIFNAAPFPPLPPGFERDSAQIEFKFKLQR
jgi:protein TonB